MSQNWPRSDKPSPLAWLRRWYWPPLVRLSRHRPYLQLLSRVMHLEGDIVECGVFRGRTLLRMAVYAKSVDESKTIFGLDSFDGFPSRSVSGVDLGPGRTMQKVLGRFKNAGYVPIRLQQVADDLGLNVELLAGYFEETLPDIASRKFCFVHVDCDIYESYMTCLNALYPSVVPGGIILFDEYACPVWPGATKAVDEFFADKPEKPIRCEDPGRPSKAKHYVVKERPNEVGSALSARVEPLEARDYRRAS